MHVGTIEMIFSIILGVPRWRIQPKQENQVYNAIVRGMQMEIPA